MTEFDTSPISDPSMPWGKYKGTKLADLPADYLLWLLEKAESYNLRPSWLNEAVKNAWKKRNEPFKAEAERLRGENK